MAAAAAEPEVIEGEVIATPKPGRKKLIVIIAAVALLLAAVGGGAVWLVKKQRAAAEAAVGADEGEEAVEPAPMRREVSATPPAFLPLEPFVVNLADRESERFAQIGITLELSDPELTERMKAYMPAIRNGILMVLAHKSSQELLTRSGKEKLAADIMRASVRPLGIDLVNEHPDAAAEPDDGYEKTPLDESPVRQVHFSSFIVQ